jgi:hypothetical protein
MSAETRSLHLTIHGKPAVRAVTEFEFRRFEPPTTLIPYSPEGTYVLASDGWVHVDQSPEEVSALWDAAAPVAAPTVARWQVFTGGREEHPDQISPETGPSWEVLGPWEIVGIAVVNDESPWLLWKRPLRRIDKNTTNA